MFPEQTISVLQHWARAHSYPCDNAPCTALVCSSPEIVTVGEDGRIVVFRADQEGAVRVIGEMRTRMLPPHQESSLKLSVVFVRECRQQHNSRGDLPEDHGGFDGEFHWPAEAVGPQAAKQLPIADSVPVRALKFYVFIIFLCIFILSETHLYLFVFFSTRSGDRAPLHCVDRHPNQQHIVATGGQDGMLCVWDVRQGGTPISLMEAHSAESQIPSLFHFKHISGSVSLTFLWISSSVWEVRFHPTNPDHLFTCSEDGSLLHWETASHSEMPTFLQGKSSSVKRHSDENFVFWCFQHVLFFFLMMEAV